MPGDLEQEIVSTLGRLDLEATACGAVSQSYLDGLSDRHAAVRERLEEWFADDIARMEQAVRAQADAAAAADGRVRDGFASRIVEIGALAPWSVLPFGDPMWGRYRPDPEVSIYSGVRIGSVAVGGVAAGMPAVPAVADVFGLRHLLISAPAGGIDVARSMMVAIVCRALVASRPGAVRVALIDPVTHGRALSPFLRLPQQLRVAERIAVTEREIDELVAELSKHVIDVTQRRLSNVYETIDDYNAATMGLSVPHHVLAVSDFPAGFSTRTAERLVELARGGPVAGVHVIAAVDRSVDLPRDFTLDGLSNTASTIRLGKKQMTWDDPALGDYPLVPEDELSADQLNALLDALGAAAADVSESLPFERIAVPDDLRWRGNSTTGLDIQIGVDSRGEPQNLVLGRGVVHHGLIGGDTQRGKSNLLQVLITQLALRYPPEEMELYLIDFKQVEFERFLQDRLPHARAVASEADREYGISVLRTFQAEIDRRGALLKKVRHSTLREYRQETGELLPRMVVVIDEFQEMFPSNDQLSTEAGVLLADVARRGAGYGLHLLMATQSPRSGETLTYLNKIYQQMQLRIALGCREPSVSFAILGEGNDAATRLLRPGDAVYDDQGGRASDAVIRIAELPNRERASWSQAVTGLARGRIYPPPASFDPSAPAELLDNVRVVELLARTSWPAAGDTVEAWLGEPVEIKPPTSATFERDIHSNLLVLGGDQAGYRMLAATVLSVAAQLGPTDARFTMVDFARSTSAFRGRLAGIAEMLPHDCETANARAAVATLGRLVAELDQRSEHPHQGYPSHFFVVAGLHRWQDLLNQYNQPNEAGLQLARLADEGPECGIHLVVWSEGLAGVERTLGHNGLRYFYLRAMMRVQEAESLRILGSPTGSRLAGERGLLHLADAEPGRAEKFKPYLLPALEPFRVLAARGTAHTAPTQEGESDD